MIKKLTALVLAASFLGCVLTACGEPGAASQPAASAPGADTQAPGGASGTEASISIGPEPVSMDPALSASADTDAYCGAVFEGLYKRDAQGNVVLGQAQQATPSADGLTWTFRLREDARWSDGQAVTADDFVYAWQRNCMLEGAAERQLFAYLKNGAALLDGSAADAGQLGVRAVDSRTLEVTLSAPCAFLDTLLLRPAFFPLRRDAVEGNRDWSRDPGTYLTNGPLRMTQWSHKESITLERSAAYYGAADVTTRKLTCRLAEDDGARLTSYDSSELAYITPLPAGDTNIRKRGDLLLQGQDAVACLQFSTAQGPLADSRVRRALSLAIDRDALAVEKTALRCEAAQALVPAGFADAGPDSDFRAVGGPCFSAESADYAENLVQAGRLLDEAGYQDRKKLGELTVTNEVGTLAETVSNAVAAMWRDKLGVSCKVVSKQNRDYRADCAAGKVQVTFTVLRAGYDDASALLSCMSKASAANVAGFADVQYEALLEQARTAADGKTRCGALHQAEKYLMEQMPVSPLFVLPHTALAAGTTGASVSPDGVVSLAYLQKDLL